MSARPLPRRGWATTSGAAPAWTRERLAGRLTEISATGGAAPLTLAFGLVLDAQRQGETVAWVGRQGSSFFPPDAAAGGVDLDALAVVRVPDEAAVARCADRLLRSGAFGLVVLDLGARPRVPPAVLTRLARLAERHDTALVCLTRKARERASLGALVSVRAQARRKRGRGRGGGSKSESGYRCEAQILKDKGRAAGWTHAEDCLGPPGLC